MRKTICWALVASVGMLTIGPWAGAQEGPRVRGTTIAITGENPFISLAREAGEKPLTSVSFWRVVHSPAGMGHACYVTSDLTGDGPSADDLRVVFTDNEELLEYLNREIMTVFDGKHLDNPYPVVKATFTRQGDTRGEYRELIAAEQHSVELVWKQFLPALQLEIPVGSLTIATTIIPAQTAEVHIDGVKAAGSAFPRPEGTAQGSSASLAWAETWFR
jgi:hypothetical protein